MRKSSHILSEILLYGIGKCCKEGSNLTKGVEVRAKNNSGITYFFLGGIVQTPSLQGTNPKRLRATQR